MENKENYSMMANLDYSKIDIADSFRLGRFDDEDSPKVSLS